MISFFDINKIFFELWGYQMSYIEFFGTIAGFVAVFLASRANIWSWPIGLINVTLFFFLFYQVQLYPDMFLQVFFFVTNVMGWWRWTHPKPFEEDRKRELKISFMRRKEAVIISFVAFAGTVLTGLLAQELPNLLPAIFTKPSAVPFLDSFITVVSIIATFYMIQKKVECWIMWLLVDMVATYVYFSRDIKLYAVLYLVFCFIAAFGLWNWIREYRSYKR